MAATAERLRSVAPHTAAPALPPGPGGGPLVSVGWLLRPLPLLERWRAQYGSTFTIKLPQEPPWVVVSDPQDIKAVFQGDPAILHAGEGNQILRPVIGEHSVLLLDGERHMRQRKLMLPPFHGERMQRHVETMAEAAREEIARWPEGVPFALHPHMQAVTLEVIVRVVFGDRDAQLRDALKRLIDLGTDPRIMATVALIGTDRFERSRLYHRAMDPVNDAILATISRRRAEPDLDARDDVLSMLVQARHEDGSPMSDQELRDELMTLLVAGHETTATALAWAIERLVRHPEMLDRLQSGDAAYLDAVITETLRRRPVLALVLRKLKAPWELNGRLLPEGVAVSPNIHLVHHDPRIYPEPYAFRPERFLDVKPGTYEWIPFGGGIRRCIGASALTEMRTVLAEIVRAVRLRPADPAPERVARRAITWTPNRGATVIAEAA
jgi:cytochrome P450